MPRLAIIIGAVRGIESLEATLVSVLENRPADCEILVALDRPYDDPYDLKGEVRFIESPRRTNFVACVNRALATACSPFVHLLSSGCTVTEGWAEPALARFGDRRIASVSPVVVDAEDPARIVAAGLAYHRGGRRELVAHVQSDLTDDTRPLTKGPCWFAAFYRKAALERVGGWNPELGLAQVDADVAVALATAGLLSAVEPESRIRAHAGIDAGEPPFRHALHEERLYWRNLPETGWIGSVVLHASAVAVEVLRNLPRPAMLATLAGRALACGQLGSYVRRRAALRQLAESERGSSRRFKSTRVDRSHATTSVSHSRHSGARTR